MFRTVSIGLLILCAVLQMQAAERSFTISFGAENSSTVSLSNSSFMDAVSSGKSYIAGVTSVVSVFPETDCIRLSSNKTNGKFNIELSNEAQVVAKRIVIRAARYENDRDAEALLMINSEPLFIPSVSIEDYTIHIPSKPERQLTNLILDAEKRIYLYSITIFYDSDNEDVEPEKEQVEAPYFTPNAGRVSVGTQVEISTVTEGATIYYTIDGTLPTSASMIYSVPVVLYNDLVIKAFAVKDGMDASAVSEASYSVHNPGAEQVSEFDFNNPESLNPAMETPEIKEWINLDGTAFSDGDASVSFAATGSGNTSVRLYHSYDAGTDLRLYDGDSMTIRSLNPNLVLEKAEFVTSLSGTTADVDFVASIGEYEWLTNTWRADSETVREVTLTSKLQSRIASMTVTLKNLSGIEAINYDHDERAAFYNLQGARIGAGAPSPGLYIRVSGRKAEKVLIR